MYVTFFRKLFLIYDINLQWLCYREKVELCSLTNFVSVNHKEFEFQDSLNQLRQWPHNGYIGFVIKDKYAPSGILSWNNNYTGKLIDYLGKTCW